MIVLYTNIFDDVETPWSGPRRLESMKLIRYTLMSGLEIRGIQVHPHSSHATMTLIF